LNLAFKLEFDILYLDGGEIKFQGANRDFFSKESLKNIFKESIKRVDDYFLVNL